MKQSAVISKILALFKKDREFRLPVNLKTTTRLAEAGVFDSFSVIKLVTFLEKEFSIRIKPEDLLEENFMTLQAIEKMVLKKKKNTLRK